MNIDTKSYKNDENEISNLYEGIIRIVNSYEGYVTINNKNNDKFDVYIYSYNNFKNILHGDTVLIKIIDLFRGKINKKKLNNNLINEEINEELNNNNLININNIQNSIKNNNKPKYQGNIIKVIKSVTDQIPIIGYIRPINYLYNIKKNKNKLNDNYIKYFNILGINNKNSKFRIELIPKDIEFNSKKLCFVPIKKIYPIIKLKLDEYSINKFIIPYLIKNNNKQFIPSKLLLGGQVIRDHNNNIYIKIIKVYGLNNNNTTHLIYLLDYFNLSKHIELYNLFGNKKFNISLSSKYWKKQNRKIFDINEYKIFTIDPLTAKDLDDAIHIKFDKLSNIFEIGIHIADVYYYILNHKKILTKIIKELCTSIYLPHFNFPMLPRQFSSNLCSLLPNEMRPTLSLIIKLDLNGNIINDPIFYLGIITSIGKFSYENIDNILSIIKNINIKKKNLTYEQKVQNYLNNSNIISIMNNSYIKNQYRKDIIESILLLNKINKILYIKRMKNQPIKLFDVKTNYNFSNKIIKENQLYKIKNTLPLNYKTNYFELLPNIEMEINIYKKNSNFNLNNILLNNIIIIKNNSKSHNLIEELMLLANNITAKYIIDNLPDSYNILRSHDEIDNSQLKILINYLKKNYMSNIFSNNIDRKNLFKGLSKIYSKYGLLIYCTISELLRDIFKRAKYIVFNKKKYDKNISTHHYALNMDFYTHFTSPIRRITDIIVHQSLYKILYNKNIYKIKNNIIFKDDEIKDICENANIKFNYSKTFQREIDNILFTQLISKNNCIIPSISCIYKIKKKIINTVLLYPTNICSVFLIEDNEFKKLDMIREFFYNKLSFPYKIENYKKYIKLIWKYNNSHINNLNLKYKISKKNIINHHLDQINKLLDKSFQFKIIINESENIIIQNIGIWSYLPVYIIPLKTIPPKFTIIPINPIEYLFYIQLLNYN